MLVALRTTSPLTVAPVVGAVSVGVVLGLAFAYVILALPFAYRAIDAGLRSIDLTTLTGTAKR